MKQIITVFLMVTMMSIAMPLTAAKADAATAPTAVTESYESGVAPCYGGRTYRVRRTSRNRKLVNALIAGGIGAAIGGGIGGGRGALVGLGAGSGGYLLYKYVKDRRGRCVPRYVGRG